MPKRYSRSKSWNDASLSDAEWKRAKHQKRTTDNVSHIGDGDTVTKGDYCTLLENSINVTSSSAKDAVWVWHPSGEMNLDAGNEKRVATEDNSDKQSEHTTSDAEFDLWLDAIQDESGDPSRHKKIIKNILINRA